MWVRDQAFVLLLDKRAADVTGYLQDTHTRRDSRADDPTDFVSVTIVCAKGLLLPQARGACDVSLPGRSRRSDSRQSFERSHTHCFENIGRREVTHMHNQALYLKHARHTPRAVHVDDLTTSIHNALRLHT